MLIPMELLALRQDLANTMVLSAYLDIHVIDPALRHTGRPTLRTALQAARGTDRLERARFDRGAAFLEDPYPGAGRRCDDRRRT